MKVSTLLHPLCLCFVLLCTSLNAQIFMLDSFPSMEQFNKTAGIKFSDAGIFFFDELEVFVDSSGNTTFEQVLEDKALFKSNTTDTNYDIQFPHWAKIQLRGHSERDDEYLFMISSDGGGYYSWEQISAYLVHENDSISQVVTGNAIPNAEKPIPSELNFAKFHIKKDEEVTLYIRLEGEGSTPYLDPYSIILFLVHEEMYPGAFKNYPFQGIFGEYDDLDLPFHGNELVNYSIYIDPTREADIDYIATNWENFSTEDPLDIVQEVSKVYWLKTKLIGNSYLVGKQLLHISNLVDYDGLSFDYIDAYISNGKGTFTHQAAGDRLSQAEPSYLFWANLIPVQVLPNDTLDIYIRLEGSDKEYMMSNIVLQHIDKDSLFPGQLNKALADGIFFGILGVQFLFFFLLFLIERDTIHFYFSLIVLGSFIAIAADWGSYNFILPPALKAWQFRLHFFGLFLAGAGFLKFTETYFNYENRNPISKRWIPVFLLLGGFSTLLAIIHDNPNDINYLLVLFGLNILFSLFLAIKAPIQKGNSKRFYFIAFIPAAICTFILLTLVIISNTGGIEDFIFSFFEQLNNLVKVCIVALLTLLALSIGYRTNVLKADQQLAIALAEKNTIIQAKNAQNELLLKEIHHRVKNNLEVVSSLLELQSAQTKDAEAQSVMKASQSRVQSMGIIHQKLYQGENLASIEMKDYFKNLCDSILDTYEAWDDVSIEYDMDEVELDVDTAVPIGLIVNELLTNALKYAFTDGEKGHIRLNLEELANRKLQLVVEDDGIGKAKNAEVQGTGFGSQLIQLLTRQLNGTMREEVMNGTRFVFNFKHKTF